ncbi:hypothetical protein [Actinopolymorpha cephalotaxi]|uniref:Uncharacterized protein n=1 Tax=Actinopolymorpha cephalotaxi TaxID=504797 RepID=A0ABX2SCU3_9ACTN|nr:hypothetical protein [Actinopolymorpha cephalotaxi]NYH86743.1 hypothetical protein [Actinopolymorpha cephalotaxi]
MESSSFRGVEHQVHRAVDACGGDGFDVSGADAGVEDFGDAVAGEHAGGCVVAGPVQPVLDVYAFAVGWAARMVSAPSTRFTAAYPVRSFERGRHELVAGGCPPAAVAGVDPAAWRLAYMVVDGVNDFLELLAPPPGRHFVPVDFLLAVSALLPHTPSSKSNA